MPAQSPPFQFSVRSILLLQAHVAAGIGCCSSLWRTDGEVVSGIGWMFFCVITVVALVLWTAGHRKKTICLLLVVWAPLALRQALLLDRLARLESEVLRLSAYLKTCARDTSGYPEISGYRFRDPRLRKYIRLWPHTNLISYKLYDGDNTCREYSPSRGWYYYPD